MRDSGGKSKGALSGWMSPAPWIHLLPYLFLQSVVMAHLDCTFNSGTLLLCSWDANRNFTSRPCYISAYDEKRCSGPFNQVTVMVLETEPLPIRYLWHSLREGLQDQQTRDIQGFCFLTPNGNPRNCAMNLTTDGKPMKEILPVDHKLNLSVICSSGIESNTSVTFLSDFSVYHNLCLDPPLYTQIRMISYGVWELTWNISHSSTVKDTETEIHYKPVHHLWQDAQNVTVKNVNLVTLYKLHPDTEYEAKVRVNQMNFPGGRWSDWGKPAQWTTPHEGRLDCTHNSFDTVSCSWEVARNFVSTPCYLAAYVNNYRSIKGNCYLPPSGDLRSCVINFTVNDEYYRDALTVAHSLNVSVICSVGQKMNKTVTSMSDFFPFYSLRLDPPMFLDIEMIEDGTWNLTWHNSYRHYIDNVETEVQFKPVKWSWKDSKRFTLKQTDLSALLRDLHPDTLYEARVRINQTSFEGGMWSEWSKPLQWTTPPKGSPFPIPVVVGIVVPCVILLVILSSLKSVKKIVWVDVPDPSQFFHPLLNTHKGNFKKWLSTPYDISPFFLNPSPIDISPLNINCKNEEQHLKSPPTPKAEVNKDRTGQSGSSFTNKEYFSSIYLGYDHFPTTLVNEPLHSPTDEHMPLFQAEYLCAPQSIAWFGVHNGSFQRDAPLTVMQRPALVEEILDKPGCDDENCDISSPRETELVKEEGTENKDQKLSLDTFSTTPVAHKIGGKPLNEADVAADYLSLKELHQKHCRGV
ncbi:interleukin-2 receptor subunit beta isoform X2 [Hyla sarda]|uniref:interleukin-2 receptor subunit beta isoform X2 n=1 Tax=Hyla sarda TaxID=327740 RepID=UPI0024C2F0F3|nr:interleukin-2 receptor subunit beta isoform X2 [Hyla sarda]